MNDVEEINKRIEEIEIETINAYMHDMSWSEFVLDMLGKDIYNEYIKLKEG